MNVFARIKHALQWSRSRQFRWIQVTMYSDRQWLGANPVAATIIDRYLPLLEYNWEKAQVVAIDVFRDQLNRLDGQRVSIAVVQAGIDVGLNGDSASDTSRKIFVENAVAHSIAMRIAVAIERKMEEKGDCDG